MNLEKHENVNYREIDNFGKLLNSKLYKRHEPVFVDGEVKYFEIVSKKRTIIDKVPIATAFYILGNAKLCVLQFVRDLESCLMTDALRILYMGNFYEQIFFS